MNSVVIKGELVTDIEKSIVKDDVLQICFRLKVERDFKDRITGRRESDFFRVVAWRQQAEFLDKYAHKGDQITVKGVIQNRLAEGYSEIHADRVELDRRFKDGVQ